MSAQNKIAGTSGVTQPTNQDPSKLPEDKHILDHFRRGVDINKCTNRTKPDKTSYYADECACLAFPSDLQSICMEGYNISEKAIRQDLVEKKPNEAVLYCLEDNNVPEKYRQHPNTHQKLAYQMGCLNSIHGPMSARPN
jgi:hypothetical protein